MNWRLQTARQRWFRWFLRLVSLLILAASWRYISGLTLWEFVGDAPAQARDLFGRMTPPDWGSTAGLLHPLWDTITIATFGTLLAVIAAVPVALLAARNTAPFPAVRPFALLLIVSSRSINALVWALLLVALFGPGQVAGILAIAFRSIGFIAKLLYETIEESDPAPAEAVAATGAGGPLVLAYGIWPQVLPAFAGITLFRWDINIREATILGLVGAGGIGLPLDAAVSALQWPRAAMILLLIVGLVLAAEVVSARARQAVT